MRVSVCKRVRLRAASAYTLHCSFFPHWKAGDRLPVAWLPGHLMRVLGRLFRCVRPANHFIDVVDGDDGDPFAGRAFVTMDRTSCFLFNEYTA